MKQKTLVLAAVGVVAGLAGGLLCSQRAFAAVQTCTWTGTAGDNKFSTATNWSNCGGATPLAGDIVRFDARPTGDKSLTNDLAVKLGGLLVTPTAYAAGNGNYTVNTLAFGPGALLKVESTTTCDGAVQIMVGGLSGDGDVTIENNAVYLGTMTGSASVNIAGILRMAGVSPISPVASGSSAASIVAGFVAPYRPATCGMGGGSSSGALDVMPGMTYGSLTVENGAMAYLKDMTKPVILGGGSGTGNPVLWFLPDVDESYNPVTTTRSWSGPVTLLSSASVYVGSMTTVTYTGAITGSDKTLTKDLTSGGVLTFSPSSNTTATPSGTQVNPVKTTTITDKTSQDLSIVANETAVFDGGQRGGVSVMYGGLVKGSGTMDRLWVDVGGRVAPGMSPGCISAGTISMSGTYSFELGGTDPCTGYDQLLVTGTSPSSLYINTTTAVLETARYNSYTPKKGQVFVIINQAGTQAVTGTFKDLPEGATFTQNGIVFKISYIGGDGNDVTLTVQNTPTVPNTGFSLVTAHPVMTLIATVAAALGLVVIARRTQQKHHR